MKTIRHFFICNICFLLGILLGISLWGCAPQRASEETFHSQNPSRALVGGTVVKERSTTAAKSVVFIEFLNQHHQEISLCAAALIGPQTLLTAAHCFDPQRVQVHFFRVVFLTQKGSRGNRKVRWGRAFSMHPRYNKKKVFDHDLAVATFEGPLPAGFAPVNIDSDLNANYALQKVYVYGYGRSSALPGGKENKGGNRVEETERLRRGEMVIGADYYQYPDRYLTSTTSQTFLCTGDSGGPQFYHENGILKIVGVNSAHFGELLPNGKRACTGLAQATKVAPFYDWIKGEEKKLLNRMK